MREEATSTKLAEITEEGESSAAACATLVDALREANVEVLDTPRPISIGVGPQMALRRLLAVARRHTEALAAATTTGTARPVNGPVAEEDFDADDEDAVEARRTALMESAAVAQRLIASGFKDLSCLRTRCPVTGAETTAAARYPVVHHHHVYFCSSAKALARFCATPTAFLSDGAVPTGVPPTACVIGGPLTGKTTLSRRLAEATGALLLDPQTCLAWAIQPENATAIGSATRARALLLAGKSVKSPQATFDESDYDK